MSAAEVVTLCGSTKFKADFMAENQRLTMDGHVVISLGVFGHTDRRHSFGLPVRHVSPVSITVIRSPTRSPVGRAVFSVMKPSSARPGSGRRPATIAGRSLER